MASMMSTNIKHVLFLDKKSKHYTGRNILNSNHTSSEVAPPSFVLTCTEGSSKWLVFISCWHTCSACPEQFSYNANVKQIYLAK